MTEHFSTQSQLSAAMRAARDAGASELCKSMRHGKTVSAIMIVHVSKMFAATQLQAIFRGWKGRQVFTKTRESQIALKLQKDNQRQVKAEATSQVEGWSEKKAGNEDKISSNSVVCQEDSRDTSNVISEQCIVNNGYG